MNNPDQPDHAAQETAPIWTMATVPKALLALVFALVAIVLTYFKALGAGDDVWPSAWQAVVAVLTVIGVYAASNARFKYLKTVVAILGTVMSALTPYLANGLENLTPDQWLLALGALGTAFGVYVVPTQPPFEPVNPYDASAHDGLQMGELPAATD